MSKPFGTAAAPTPTVEDLEASTQRIVFTMLAVMVLVLATAYTVGHFSAGRWSHAALAATMLAAVLGTTAHACRTRRFVWPLRVLMGTATASVAIATLGQGASLPAAAWWLSVAPFLLAAGGLHWMAIGVVGVFLAVVTWLFAGGPELFTHLPLDDDISAYRRYAAVAGSELLGLTAIIVSMRLRFKVARALESARIDAQEAAAIKARFLANMSHEIRAPLTGIIGVADVLDGPGLSDAQRRQLIGLQKQSASTLLALVNDILDASKLDAHKVVLESVPFDLRLVVQEVNELFAMQAFAKGIELTSSCSPDLPASVLGDPVRVRQVLTNLVGNAVKFTREGGVHLHASLEPAPGRMIRFEVSDSGPGIAADRLKLLFRPFVQADEAVTRQYGGTGLGLSISSELSRLMGGGIEVRSTVGRGSTFIARLALPVELDARSAGVPQRRPDVVLASATAGLERHVKARLHELGIDPLLLRRMPTDGELDGCRWLLVDAPLLDSRGAPRWLAAQEAAGRKVIVLAPMGADLIAGGIEDGQLLYKPVGTPALEGALREAPRPDAAAEAPHQRPLAGSRVLVADDNPVNQIVVKEMLATLGVDAMVVEDGRAALDALEQQPYELVLMDVNMPTMDGLEATRQLRLAEHGSGRRPTTVLAMTASTEDEDGLTCMAAGMDGFLAKPFSIAQLQATLERAFRRPPRTALAAADAQGST